MKSTQAIKKITFNVPQKLLKQALDTTHKGITETIKMGLQLLAAGHAYDMLANMKGKYHSSIKLEKLREDRS